MLVAGLVKVDPCWAPNGRWRHFHPLLKKKTTLNILVGKFCCCFFLCRTLPGKHLDAIASQFRLHSINALLVIGGFEVCQIPFTWT